ncbi:MAG: aminotransferase class V-fold PLP-dependent enzyme [Opitutales bacterium]|nr:aminotransferase class V-fold PLP-dependent enzyme [Opitutales bacterium]
MKKFIPNKECLQKLNEAAKDIYAHRFNQLGYPFNQETDLSEFYQWLVDTKLADLTLINVGDPYKTDWDMLNTDYFEQKAIDFIAESFGFDENHWGVIANGGTDGNMHGIYFGRKALAAKSNLPPILYVSKEAHYSLKKIGDIQNIEVRTINAHEMGEMDTQDFAEKLDSSRPALVAIAIGGTFKGAIDNQKEIDTVLKAKKPVAYYRHLDVALFGGYLPYLDNKEANNIVNAAKMDFDSIAVSGHKFLSLNEPAGIFVCHKDILNCVSNTPIPYLKGVIPTISCSRSGFDALKLYWRLMSVGKNGLKEQANHSMAMAVLLEEELKNANVKAWRNKFSNTVFFERPNEEIVKKYALACNDDEHFGKLSHIVTMQYFDEKLIKQIVADIAKK